MGLIILSPIQLPAALAEFLLVYYRRIAILADKFNDLWFRIPFVSARIADPLRFLPSDHSTEQPNWAEQDQSCARFSEAKSLLASG